MGNFSMNIILNFKHIFYCPQLGMCKRYHKLIRILFQYQLKGDCHIFFFTTVIFWHHCICKADNQGRMLLHITWRKYPRQKSSNEILSSCDTEIHWFQSDVITPITGSMAPLLLHQLNINSCHCVTNLDFGRLFFDFVLLFMPCQRWMDICFYYFKKISATMFLMCDGWFFKIFFSLLWLFCVVCIIQRKSHPECKFRL